MSDNFGMLFIYSDRRSCEFKRKTKLDKTQVNLMLFLESFCKKHIAIKIMIYLFSNT